MLIHLGLKKHTNHKLNKLLIVYSIRIREVMVIKQRGYVVTSDNMRLVAYVFFPPRLIWSIIAAEQTELPQERDVSSSRRRLDGRRFHLSSSQLSQLLRWACIEAILALISATNGDAEDFIGGDDELHNSANGDDLESTIDREACGASETFTTAAPCFRTQAFLACFWMGAYQLK